MGSLNERLRQKVRGVTKALIRKITGWGLDVTVIYSERTKSRYLEFQLDGRQTIIRVSDHPSRKFWRYDYDVYVEAPRRFGVNYETMVKILVIRVQQKKKEDLQKVTKSGNFGK
jgi:hypothetical protein